MAADDIADTIKALKEESEKLRSDDEHTLQKISALISRLETEVEPEHPQSISDHINSMIESTEARHPQLTLILNDLMVKLASIGV